MRKHFFGLSLIALSATLGACSGHNFNSYDLGNQGHYGQASYHDQSAYQSQAYGGHEYSVQPTYSAYDQGTVLRGSAPYGVAVNNLPYTNINGQAIHNGVYSNFGGVAYDVDGEFVGGKKMYGVQGRLGYDLSPNFALEAEASAGVTEEANQKIDYSTGLFGVVKTPISQNLSAHLRGGYHVTRLDRNGGDFTTDGFAYGGGFEYMLSDRDSIRVDYTKYENIIGGQVSERPDAVSISYGYKY